MPTRRTILLALAALVTLLFFLTPRSLTPTNSLPKVPSFSDIKGKIPHFSYPNYGDKPSDTAAAASSSPTTSSGANSDPAISEASSDQIHIEDLNPAANSSSQLSSKARVGMVTMMFGDPDATYERALRTHQYHARRHGTPLFTLRKKILDVMYNKPMYILDLLLQEMKKPDHERMEWFFWFDADTVILNPSIPPSTFLPPRDFGNVHFLAAEDFNGLNAGVFFLRVSSWSIEVMSSVISYRTFRPNDALPFAEQTALEKVIHEDKYSEGKVFYPQRWFNAYSGATRMNETVQPWQLHRGDMMVHFAGVPDRQTRMDEYMDIFEKHMPEWEIEVKYTSYPSEMDEFWEDRRQNERQEKTHVKELEKEARKLLGEMGTKIIGAEGLNENDRSSIDQKMSELRDALDHGKSGQLETAIQSLKDSSSPLESLEQSSRKDALRKAHETIIEAQKLSEKYTALNSADSPSAGQISEVAQTLADEATKLRDYLIENSGKADDVKKETEALELSIKNFQEVWEPKATATGGSDQEDTNGGGSPTGQNWEANSGTAEASPSGQGSNPFGEGYGRGGLSGLEGLDSEITQASSWEDIGR
ncbi:MAG: hypothetical protein Q9227_005939 [Pyrenula ochraceoflavens]